MPDSQEESPKNLNTYVVAFTLANGEQGSIEVKSSKSIQDLQTDLAEQLKYHSEEAEIFIESGQKISAVFKGETMTAGLCETVIEAFVNIPKQPLPHALRRTR